MEFNLENIWCKLVAVAALVGVTALAHWLVARRRHSENGSLIVETLDSMTMAIALILLVVQPFILQPFWIPSGSMENTLRIDDRVLVSRAIYRLQEPNFQDVVVFEAPAATGEKSGTDYIKRCIGRPGDSIEVRKGVLFRNGKVVPEIYRLWNSAALPYDMKIVGGAVYSRGYFAANLPEPWAKNGIVASANDQASINAATPGVVPAGFLLMLGDHRSHSSDGHIWGFVPRQNVIGKAMCVFWPPTRLGLMDNLSFQPRP